jgi:hypothetical protein
MENITVRKIELSLKNSFVRVGDISFFEGPLITLFEDFNTSDLYFYDWVDRDNNCNRWLIYKVIPQELLKFLNKKISHFDLFQHVDEFFVTDINNRSGLNNYEIGKLLELPDEYIPNTDSFFNEDDCPSFDKILSFVLKSLQNSKQSNKYHSKSYSSFSFQDIAVERKNTFTDIQDIYSHYLEGSFAFETHLNLEVLPENQLDTSGMYYFYEEENSTTSKHKNVYA